MSDVESPADFADNVYKLFTVAWANNTLDKFEGAVEGITIAHDRLVAAAAARRALGEIKEYAERRAAAITQMLGHEPEAEDLGDYEATELAAYESFADVAERCRELMSRPDPELAK